MLRDWDPDLAAVRCLAGMKHAHPPLAEPESFTLKGAARSG